MKTRLSWAIGLLAFSGAAASAGCGDGQDTTEGTGSGGATASSSSSASGPGPASGPSSSVSSSSSGSGGGADGNDTFETAVQIDGDMSESLSPTGDVDFFWFNGKEDQVIRLQIYDAQEAANAEFDATFIDTIITLYDDTQKQIAENNDPTPRRSNDSELFTILPHDGKYFVRVTECHSWATNPGTSCSGEADKANASYTLHLEEPDPAADGWVANTENGSDPANAEPIDYVAQMPGDYFLTGMWGMFEDGADVDVFSFSIPADLIFDNRSTGTFRLLPSTKNGDGSTSPPGNVWIADAATPGVAYAFVNGTVENLLQPPLVVDHPYLLFVEHPATALGANDFYFALHGVGSSNALELTDPGGNDLPANAEPVDVAPNGTLMSAFFEGDILPAPADLDHYIADVPAGLDPATTINLACGARRSGSGLRNFHGSLLDVGGTLIPGATLVESETKDFLLKGVALPAGATKIIVKIEAESQDPNVTSTFYRCGLHFIQP